MSRLLVLALLAGVVAASAVEKETPYQKDRRERQARIEATPPKFSSEQTYRLYFAAMQNSQWVRAAELLHRDALDALKAKTLAALREAPRSRRAEFCQRAEIGSIPQLQHTPPLAFFRAVMRDGQLVKTYLARLRGAEIESIHAEEHAAAAQLRIFYRNGTEEDVSAVRVIGAQSQEWRLVVIPPLD